MALSHDASNPELTLSSISPLRVMQLTAGQAELVKSQDHYANNINAVMTGQGAVQTCMVRARAMYTSG